MGMQVQPKMNNQPSFGRLIVPNESKVYLKSIGQWDTFQSVRSEIQKISTGVEQKIPYKDIPKNLESCPEGISGERNLKLVIGAQGNMKFVATPKKNPSKLDEYGSVNTLEIGTKEGFINAAKLAMTKLQNRINKIYTPVEKGGFGDGFNKPKKTAQDAEYIERKAKEILSRYEEAGF